MKALETLRLRDARDNLYEIAPDVVSMLRKHRQHSLWGREKGGQLFLRTRSLDRISIDYATEPNPADRATRTSLELDHFRCSEELRRANQRGYWLIGYWHTHPQSQPQISPADIDAMRQGLKCEGYCLKAILALIVGNSDRYDFFSAYLIHEQSIEKLSQKG